MGNFIASLASFFDGSDPDPAIMGRIIWRPGIASGKSAGR
jgi:hypothetical protein